jgi:hypothetical protein
MEKKTRQRDARERIPVPLISNRWRSNKITPYKQSKIAEAISVPVYSASDRRWTGSLNRETVQETRSGIAASNQCLSRRNKIDAKRYGGVANKLRNRSTLGASFNIHWERQYSFKFYPLEIIDLAIELLSVLLDYLL